MTIARLWLLWPVSIGLGVVASACAQTVPAPASTMPAAATTLEIRVWPEGERQGVARDFSLICDGTPAGDHPDPAAACAALSELGAGGFQPVPPDAMCTQQYGGPMEAQVRGVIGGQDVQARLAYTDGCQIARWNRLAAVVPHPRSRPD